MEINNKIKIGVIPAAGRGLRAYPKTKFIPKPLIEIENKPILQRNIEIMRDSLGVKNIYVIVNHFKSKIQDYFGNGSKFGVNLNYVVQEQLSGIGSAIYLLKDKINENFVVILGDEIYIDSNHADLLKTAEKYKDYDAICSFLEVNDRKKIQRNFSAVFVDNRIKSLIEKPKNPKNNFLGCGTYVFSPRIFKYIEKTPKSKLRNEVEITDAINNLALEIKKVYPFFLKGDYTNITNVDDINSVNYYLRSKNFDKYKTSLVIPAYNEEETIAQVIKEFKSQKIDEILVVDNNSKDNTVQISRAAGATVISEHKQGYGNAIKAGLNKSKGDIIIITEADGSFRSKDLSKILEYMKDADMVMGTRTTRQLIEQGANMNWFLRWGNVFFGKLIEVLWWGQEPRFTDVGCTFRAIWRSSYLKIKDNLNQKGPEFSPEMMIEALKSRLRIIEIPVSYYRRIGGESKHSAGLNKIKTGLKMLKLILKKRFFNKK